ncbi:MAG: hypothetical protein ACYDH9_24100 [Limisphaerales bacterium]
MPLIIEINSGKVDFVDKHGAARPAHSGDPVDPGEVVHVHPRGKCTIHDWANGPVVEAKTPAAARKRTQPRVAPETTVTTQCPPAYYLKEYASGPQTHIQIQTPSGNATIRRK